MHIRYELKPSIHHGIGLFSGEDIKERQLIYSEGPELDVNLTIEKFNTLSEPEEKEVQYWGYWNKEKGVWHVDFDSSRFINHSSDPNITRVQGDSVRLVALRDITAGEELTQNYREFESEEELRKRGIVI